MNVQSVILWQCDAKQQHRTERLPGYPQYFDTCPCHMAMACSCRWRRYAGRAMHFYTAARLLLSRPRQASSVLLLELSA
eukprot:6201985-Pleurochrysis_carterae.AAC.5